MAAGDNAIVWDSSIALKSSPSLIGYVLRYKHESELEAYDIKRALYENDFDVRAEILHRRELSEYEMSYEAMGLPRHFGRPSRRRHR